MKRLWLVCVALLTFATGIVVTWGYYGVVRDLLDGGSSRLHGASGELQIVSQETINAQDGYEVEFRIRNGGAEIARYSGYTRNDTCLVKIKREGRIERPGSICWCGTGLKVRTLSPGESVTFRISALELTLWGLSPEDWSGSIGFEFLIGQARHSQTIWSKEIELRGSQTRRWRWND